MSRVGKQPIPIPSGVSVTLNGQAATVNGSKGSLSWQMPAGISAKQEADQLVVSRANEEAPTRAKHGLTRALLANMVEGVSQGFSKKLEVSGVGYRVSQQGTDLKLALGLSHDIIFKIPTGVTTAVEQNSITVSGIDAQQVGQVAAEIRALRKPEPYKGKGISYSGERILRKSGKSGKEK